MTVSRQLIVHNRTQLAKRTPQRRDLVVGIDGTNLRRGGGRTHLVEILGAADPLRHGVERVVVWGNRDTLALIEDRPWLEKLNSPALDKGLIRRFLWQRLRLSSACRAAGCDLLWVPGGLYYGDFHPVVTMSRNLLPFEWGELRRYSWSMKAVRLLLLRVSQSLSFRRADGIIFLTQYARRAVMQVTRPLAGMLTVIPHGLNRRFLRALRPPRSILDCSDADPFQLLYVSIVEPYKHQWHLVEAVAQLRAMTGWPLALDLVGACYPPALRRLERTLQRCDSARDWVTYHGSVAHADLPDIYGKADLGVFASSCENMPNILLETMAAGLPVACSRRGPMREILRDAGCYFDPVAPAEIAGVLRYMIDAPERRADLAQASFQAAQDYTWDACAAGSFDFLVRQVVGLEGRNEAVTPPERSSTSRARGGVIKVLSPVGMSDAG